MIATVNFSLTWILLGILSLIIFVYKVSIIKGEGEKRYFPAVSFIVIIVSLLFFASSQFIGNFIPNHLQITNTELGPSLSSTASITKQVLVNHPVLGLGPN
ncbi:MAG: hypothetical protein ACREGC_00730, partial [Minisyncoccia bacterium]